MHMQDEWDRIYNILFLWIKRSRVKVSECESCTWDSVSSSGLSLKLSWYFTHFAVQAEL